MNDHVIYGNEVIIIITFILSNKFRKVSQAKNTVPLSSIIHPTGPISFTRQSAICRLQIIKGGKNYKSDQNKYKH